MKLNTLVPLGPVMLNVTKGICLNKKELELSMKAARKVGIKIRRFTSMVGPCLVREYNNAGDTTSFNPYTNFADAMLLVRSGKLCVEFSGEEFMVWDEPKVGWEVKAIRISFAGKHKKSDDYRIGNAVVNMVNDCR